jgi:hypothetical protein
MPFSQSSDPLAIAGLFGCFFGFVVFVVGLAIAVGCNGSACAPQDYLPVGYAMAVGGPVLFVVGLVAIRISKRRQAQFQPQPLPPPY